MLDNLNYANLRKPEITQRPDAIDDKRALEGLFFADEYYAVKMRKGFRKFCIKFP